jgi:hypothetical protein
LILLFFIKTEPTTRTRTICETTDSKKRYNSTRERKYIKNPLNKNNYKPIIYTATGIGILCVIALVGFVSGGFIS